jgi:hypothetical protein
MFPVPGIGFSVVIHSSVKNPGPEDQALVVENFIRIEVLKSGIFSGHG